MASRAYIDTLRSLAFGGIGASWAPIGAKLEHPTRIVKLFNDTNERILFSDDGINTKEILPPGGFTLLDISTNRGVEPVYGLPEQRFWYAKHDGVAPTARSVYVMVVY